MRRNAAEGKNKGMNTLKKIAGCFCIITPLFFTFCALTGITFLETSEGPLSIKESIPFLFIISAGCLVFAYFCFRKSPCEKDVKCRKIDNNKITKEYSAENINERLEAFRSAIKDARIVSDIAEIQKLAADIFGTEKNGFSNNENTRRIRAYYIPTLFDLLLRFEKLDNRLTPSDTASELKENIKEGISLIKRALIKTDDNIMSKESLDLYSDLKALDAVFCATGLITTCNDIKNV